MFEIPQFEVEFTPSTRMLRGLDEIGAYLRVHRRTAWRWIKNYGLPAMQSPGRVWITTTSLIDLWILSCRSIQLGRSLRDIEGSYDSVL